MVCDSLLDGQRDPALCPTAEDLRMELEGLLKAINIINRLTVEVDVMEALNSVRQVAVELLDCEVVTLFLVFESRKELRGQPHGDSNYIIRVRFGEGIAGRVAQSGELMNIPDTYAHPLFNSEVDRATGFRTRNMLCCAISDMTGRNVAVLQALNKRHGAQFTAADERTLRLFGTHLGNTLAKAKLHDKARREQERLSALYQCFRALTLADDLDHVLELVATALRGVLHAEHAFVFVADLPRNELWARFPVPGRQDLAMARVQLGTGLVGQAAAQRVVRILNREVLQDGSVAPSIAYSRSISLVHRQEDDSADTRAPWQHDAVPDCASYPHHQFSLDAQLPQPCSNPSSRSSLDGTGTCGCPSPKLPPSLRSEQVSLPTLKCPDPDQFIAGSNDRCSPLRCPAGLALHRHKSSGPRALNSSPQAQLVLPGMVEHGSCSSLLHLPSSLLGGSSPPTHRQSGTGQAVLPMSQRARSGSLTRNQRDVGGLAGERRSMSGMGAASLLAAHGAPGPPSFERTSLTQPPAAGARRGAVQQEAPHLLDEALLRQLKAALGDATVQTVMVHPLLNSEDKLMGAILAINKRETESDRDIFFDSYYSDADADAMALFALEVGSTLNDRSLECALASATSVVDYSIHTATGTANTPSLSGSVAQDVASDLKLRSQLISLYFQAAPEHRRVGSEASHSISGTASTTPNIRREFQVSRLSSLQRFGSMPHARAHSLCGRPSSQAFPDPTPSQQALTTRVSSLAARASGSMSTRDEPIGECDDDGREEDSEGEAAGQVSSATKTHTVPPQPQEAFRLYQTHSLSTPKGRSTPSRFALRNASYLGHFARGPGRPTRDAAVSGVEAAGEDWLDTSPTARQVSRSSGGRFSLDLALDAMRDDLSDQRNQLSGKTSSASNDHAPQGQDPASPTPRTGRGLPPALVVDGLTAEGGPAARLSSPAKQPVRSPPRKAPTFDCGLSITLPPHAPSQTPTQPSSNHASGPAGMAQLPAVTAQACAPSQAPVLQQTVFSHSGGHTVFFSAEQVMSWDFDFTDWEPQELVKLAYDMFLLSGLVASFGLSMRTLRAFITTVSSHYHAIPYHNFCHVCHVLHAVFLMLMTSSAAVILPAEDKLALMIAALCHDIDHDGYSNSFHVNTGSELAQIYNDISVLENHHCALTFAILRRKECALLAHLDAELQRRLRKVIVSVVLCTDMTNHFALTQDFKKHPLQYEPGSEADRLLLMKVMLHAADIGNSVRPIAVNDCWSKRVHREFQMQAQEEEALGLPITFAVDSTNPRMCAQVEVNFLCFIVEPLWERLAEVLPELAPRYSQLQTCKECYTLLAATAATTAAAEG